ncbi:hypothetical protein GHT06_001893 [Daphnia sinensis]|uniref:Baseplate protein n=1 Tax=Daphnia sinensis TaxID=1820382 RepID=A0AAD5PLC4_9CRUS|nr:hypothetical protein GHT06_001893 [Daphnia sinensis]
MTSNDDITLKTPDALYTGSAIVDLIKSCIPSISNPWKIKMTDLNTILIAIRSATHGSTMEIESKCPSCGEQNTYDINLDEMLSNLKPVTFDPVYNIGDLILKMRPLTYEESNRGNMAHFEAERGLYELNNTNDEALKSKLSTELMKKINETTNEMLADAIESISTKDGTVVVDKSHIREYIRNIDKTTHAGIVTKFQQLKSTMDIDPIHLKCNECGHEYDQEFVINMTDFFG